MEAREFVKLIEGIKPLLRESSDNFMFKNGLANIVSRGKVIVIGDIHGDLDTLNRIFEAINIESFIREKSNIIAFLGDYADRGEYGPEVLEKVFELKLKYKDQVILLRGNHEISKYWDVFPFDLGYQLKERFGNKSETVFSSLMELFDLLPFAAYIENFAFLVHGGIPIEIRSLDEIAKGDIDTLIQLVWNDPFEGYGYRYSPRGIGYLFGIDITNSFLDKNNLRFIIRGHEPCEGFKFNHNNKVITVFSSKVYRNRKAGILLLDLKDKNIEKMFI